MLATVEQHENNDLNAPVIGTDAGAQAIDLPPEVQSALDSLLDNYRCQDELSDMKLKGDPLTICKTLSERILAATPQDLTAEAKILINHIIQEIVEYCRETNTKSLNFRFSFSKDEEE